MKPGRLSYEEQSSTRMLDLWTRDESYGMPLGCVASTYTFDAALFEEECLARFLPLQTDSKESEGLYLVEREEKLSQCFVCVLVDAKNVMPQRSLRWNLLPVQVPSGGVMHAKLTLLAWQNRIRLLIGSANLTEYGVRRNQEIVAVLDFGEGCETPPELLTGAVDFIQKVQAYTPGYGSRGARGPQAGLTAFLDSVTKWARQLPISDRTPDPFCSWVPLLPGGADVLFQLKTLWRGSAPDSAWVLSPFFDEGQDAARPVRALADLLTNRGAKVMNFVAPGEVTDGQAFINAPDILRQPTRGNTQHDFYIVNQFPATGNKPEHRPLHAKSIWLQRNRRVVYMMGSSNFTAAGLGLHQRHNIEINLAYSISDIDSPFGKRCEASWPAYDLVKDAEFTKDLETDSSENDEAHALPPMFGAALYHNGEQGPKVELELSEATIDDFVITTFDERLLIDADSWRQLGNPKTVFLDWLDSRPPATLIVYWHTDSGDERKAYWVVNVADARELPLPEALSELTLNELLEILTSAKPLHDVVADIITKRKQSADMANNYELDPHKKVDISSFLLQRMRRLAHALEGMEHRLSIPLSSKEALEWRLFGPIGPLALAKQLIAEQDPGAAFMITEIASTLHHTNWQPVGSIGIDDVQREIRNTQVQLHELAFTIPTPPSLSEYVKSEFERMLA